MLHRLLTNYYFLKIFNGHDITMTETKEFTHMIFPIGHKYSKVTHEDIMHKNNKYTIARTYEGDQVVQTELSGMGPFIDVVDYPVEFKDILAKDQETGNRREIALRLCDLSSMDKSIEHSHCCRHILRHYNNHGKLYYEAVLLNNYPYEVYKHFKEFNPDGTIYQIWGQVCDGFPHSVMFGDGTKPVEVRNSKGELMRD